MSFTYGRIIEATRTQFVNAICFNFHRWHTIIRHSRTNAPTYTVRVQYLCVLTPTLPRVRYSVISIKRSVIIVSLFSARTRREIIRILCRRTSGHALQKYSIFYRSSVHTPGGGPLAYSLHTVAGNSFLHFFFGMQIFEISIFIKICIIGIRFGDTIDGRFVLPTRCMFELRTTDDRTQRA